MAAKMTALIAAAFLAGSCTLAMAQAGGGAGGGGAGGGGAAGGAGSDVATPRANSGPGGPSKSTMAKKPRMKKHKKHAM